MAMGQLKRSLPKPLVAMVKANEMTWEWAENKIAEAHIAVKDICAEKEEPKEDGILRCL